MAQAEDRQQVHHWPACWGERRFCSGYGRSLIAAERSECNANQPANRRSRATRDLAVSNVMRHNVPCLESPTGAPPWCHLWQIFALSCQKMLPLASMSFDQSSLNRPGSPIDSAIKADLSPEISLVAGCAPSVQRRWGIDSTDYHRLYLASHHLWLRNPQALYGVESASLAPGRDAVQKGRQ